MNALLTHDEVTLAAKLNAHGEVAYECRLYACSGTTLERISCRALSSPPGELVESLKVKSKDLSLRLGSS